MNPIRRLGWLALASLALAGCDNAAGPNSPAGTAPGTENSRPSPSSEPKNDIKPMPVDPKDAPKAEDAKKEAATDKEKAGLTDAEVAEIKKLPAEDQAAALAQVTCPVSHEKLGSMDVPVKQKIGDRTFFICCDGCQKKVQTKPDEVLAALDASKSGK